MTVGTVVKVQAPVTVQMKRRVNRSCSDSPRINDSPSISGRLSRSDTPSSRDSSSSIETLVVMLFFISKSMPIIHYATVTDRNSYEIRSKALIQTQGVKIWNGLLQSMTSKATVGSFKRDSS